MNQIASRGLILVAAAVLVGAFVLGRGFDTPGASTIEVGDLVDEPDTGDDGEGDAATDDAAAEDEAVTDGAAAEDGAVTDGATDGTGTDESVIDNGVIDATDSGVDPTTTTGQARPAAEVKVLVANGSGVAGAAGRLTDTLAAQGYVALSPDNASPQDTSRVFYDVGYDADAAAIAQFIGFPPSSLAPLTTPAPGGVDLRGANVLVVIGPDTATAG